MASIPGATINGKFKTFPEMTTKELEQLVYKTKIRQMIVLLSFGLFLGAAILTLAIGG
jgi:hypothetical protein